MSTYYQNEATLEAFSLLRLRFATEQELHGLPHLQMSAWDAAQLQTDFGKRPIDALSVRNELLVLAELAHLCVEQLTCYPTSLAEDEAALQNPALAPFGSNRRNALILLRGEKTICHYYIRLHEEARRFFAIADYTAAQVALREGSFVPGSDLERYLRSVALRLKRWQLYLEAAQDLQQRGRADAQQPRQDGFSSSSSAASAASPAALMRRMLGDLAQLGLHDSAALLGGHAQPLINPSPTADLATALFGSPVGRSAQGDISPDEGGADAQDAHDPDVDAEDDTDNVDHGIEIIDEGIVSIAEVEADAPPR